MCCSHRAGLGCPRPQLRVRAGGNPAALEISQNVIFFRNNHFYLHNLEETRFWPGCGWGEMVTEGVLSVAQKSRMGLGWGWLPG